MSNEKYKSQHKYQAKLERIPFDVKKGAKEKIQKYAKEHGYKSTNEYLKRLVKNDSGIEL